MNDVKRLGRSRRLRKKLYLDEFATVGFELDCEFKADKDAEGLDEFIVDFMVSAIEANGLAFAGSACAETMAGVVVSAQRYESVTDAQRQAVSDWLGAHADIKSVEASALTDSNLLL